MLEVIGTDEFADWYGKLPEDAACEVTKAIAIVESAGVDAHNVRVVEVPGVLRAPIGVRALGPHWFKVPDELRELSVADTAYRVMFAVEELGARIVLLYGYDSARGGTDAVYLPKAANILLAARVYGIYKKEAA